MDDKLTKMVLTNDCGYAITQLVFTKAYLKLKEL